MLNAIRRAWKRRKLIAVAVFVAQLASACASSSGVRKKLLETFPHDKAAVEQVLESPKLEQKLDRTAQFLLKEQKAFEKARQNLYDALKKLIPVLTEGRLGRGVVRYIYGRANCPDLFKAYFQAEKLLLEQIAALEKQGFTTAAEELRRNVLEARDDETIQNWLWQIFEHMIVDYAQSGASVSWVGDEVFVGLYKVVKTSGHEKLIAFFQTILTDLEEFYGRVERRKGYRIEHEKIEL